MRSNLFRHWSTAGLVDVGGWNERTVRRWITGQMPVPQPVMEWLERFDVVVSD